MYSLFTFPLLLWFRRTLDKTSRASPFTITTIPVIYDARETDYAEKHTKSKLNTGIRNGEFFCCVVVFEIWARPARIRFYSSRMLDSSVTCRTHWRLTSVDHYHEVYAIAESSRLLDGALRAVFGRFPPFCWSYIPTPWRALWRHYAIGR